VNLNQASQRINSRQDLANFLLQLLEDFRNTPDSWENRDLEAYLEAAAAWISDMDGYYANKGEQAPAQPTWRTLGEIFLAAKYYE